MSQGIKPLTDSGEVFPGEPVVTSAICQLPGSEANGSSQSVRQRHHSKLRRKGSLCVTMGPVCWWREHANCLSILGFWDGARKQSATCFPELIRGKECSVPVVRNAFIFALSASLHVFLLREDGWGLLSPLRRHLAWVPMCTPALLCGLFPWTDFQLQPSCLSGLGLGLGHGVTQKI